MKAPKIDLHIVNRTSFLFAGFVSALLLAATPASFAATNGSAMENAAPQAAYVDSVKKWGAWGLGIEPAAGGIQPPSTQPLKARNTNLSLRTNSISALAPRRTASMAGSTAPTNFAPSGATPVTTFSPPPSPNIIPVNPGATIPSGNGNLFKK